MKTTIVKRAHRIRCVSSLPKGSCFVKSSKTPRVCVVCTVSTSRVDYINLELGTTSSYPGDEFVYPVHIEEIKIAFTLGKDYCMDKS